MQRYLCTLCTYGILLLICPGWHSLALAEAEVSAEAYVITDAKTGAILESKNSAVKRQPASTTKLVTAMVVADALKLDQDNWVTISTEASSQPRRKAYLAEGDQYRARDLLKALLALSANDAATALAEAVSGSEAKFTDKMTLKAKQCGAFNTQFKSAAGLSRDDQYTTAYDLAKIMQCVREYEVIQDYCRIRKDYIESKKGKRHVITSHNRLFTNPNSPYYSIGKTGYTDLARYTYVSYVKQDKDEAIIALLGSNQLWKDAGALAEQSMNLVNPNRAPTMALMTRTTQPTLTLTPTVSRKATTKTETVEQKTTQKNSQLANLQPTKTKNRLQQAAPPNASNNKGNQSRVASRIESSKKTVATVGKQVVKKAVKLAQVQAAKKPAPAANAKKQADTAANRLAAAKKPTNKQRRGS